MAIKNELLGNQNPLVSIGMPVHNEAQCIRQAMEALLAQTFTNFELIVSDNASTDGTWDVLQDFANQDSRIVLYPQPENQGAVTNFQFVLCQAKGDYFMWAGGHDRWSSNLLEVLVGDIQANPQAALCIPHSVLIDEEDKPIKSFDNTIDTRAARSAAGRVLAMLQQMERANAFYGLHRRRVLLQALPWPNVVGSDVIILARIAAQGDIITNLSAQWYRRRNRKETHQERIQRYYAEVHDIRGLAAQYPYLAHRIALIAEFSKAKGPYRDRISLLDHGLKKLFLGPGQPRLLIREFLTGSLNLIKETPALVAASVYPQSL